MYAGYPGFCRFRVLGSLQFFLEHGLFQISLIMWFCLCATCNQTQKGVFQVALSRNCVHSHGIKTYFHWKSFALSLVLKVKVLENSLLMLLWKVFPQSLHYFTSYLFITVHLIIIFSMYIAICVLWIFKLLFWILMLHFEWDCWLFIRDLKCTLY